jgi:4-amino-4-deoxy-L-arabinose transferase-like glycosyltransferase
MPLKFPLDKMNLKKTSEISQTLPFYLFVTGVFLIIICKDIFSNGMFLDGIIYSTVSKNLANGIGTFWNPHFTATCLPDFHEHPPLAFGIQSIFYKFLGESRFTDKIYSLLTVVIAGYIIMKIWKKLGYKYGWFPLFIWITTPTVFWASYNNLLENTLTIFTSLSVFFYLKSQENDKYFFIFCSGLMLTLGFLTKGFVAFFPWTFPFLWWIFTRRKSFGKVIIDGAVIFLFTLAPLVLTILLFPVARLSLYKYIDNQVINSIRNVVTVNSRFDIVKRLLSELAPAAGLCIIFLVFVRLIKSSGVLVKEDCKKALAFILLGLTGVLPVMISMKQSGFYIIPAYPFFAIGAGIILNSSIDALLIQMNFKSKGFLFFKLIGYGLFFTGILLSLYFSDHFSRDKNKIKDTYTILTEIPQGSIININPAMYGDWSLHAYFSRFKNISLDPDLPNKREYLLIKNEDYSDTLSSKYKIIKLNARDYQLFKKK